MINFGNIKLIVWDLDETFWQGILSEGKVVTPQEHIDLIKNLVDCGVQCAICSKNDANDVKTELDKYGIFYLFVFNSIDWTAKGQRVKNIVEDMHLRFPNVLFIDDNFSNRGEVEHFCEGISTADVDIIPKLCEYFANAEKKDLAHKRLNQYKVLEEKRDCMKKIGDATAFLMQSNIKVEIKNDCLENIDRIHELLLRSNQLNFTKIRSTKEELKELFSDKAVNCGYVCVKDNYGDYGLVGFFAVKENVAIHFAFSCRTLGMGVEQYVYTTLNKPIVHIDGEVVSKLDTPVVTWINVEDNGCRKEKAQFSKKIVIHGPCDLETTFCFIKDSPNFIKEFTYVNKKGISIEQRNCTTHIVEYKTFNDAIRESESIKKLPFYDENMYKTAIYDKDNAFAVLSLFTDPNLAMYKEKASGLIVCFADAFYDLTDLNRKEEYLNGESFLHHCKFSEEDLRYIHDNFEYLGRIQPEQIIENVDYIYNNLGENCNLILSLPCEIECEKTGPYFGYKGVFPDKFDKKQFSEYDIELNKLIKQWARNKEKVIILDFNEFITGQESFTHDMNHFTRDVYYNVSQELIKIFEKTSNINVKGKNPKAVHFKAVLSRKLFLLNRLITFPFRKIKRLIKK